VRRGFEGEDAAGMVLSTIMFNAAYAPTISGTKPGDAGRAAERMWNFVSAGILNDASD
jgi:hypothetical protein